MSTKCTISYDDKYHLYEECLDTSIVYLSIETEIWEFRNNEVTVGIPIDIWRKLVKEWCESWWGKNPQKDNYVMTEEDWNNNLKSLESIIKERKKDD